jgi:hypothetical protein
LGERQQRGRVVVSCVQAGCQHLVFSEDVPYTSIHVRVCAVCILRFVALRMHVESMTMGPCRYTNLQTCGSFCMFCLSAALLIASMQQLDQLQGGMHA